MPKPPTTLTDEIGIALGNLADAATSPFTPTLRLGVTGLSRSGKTIFITALVHNLLTGGQLPGFSALSEGRFIGARIAESPDASIPRFAYDDHLRALTGKIPHWPESTRRISQLRLTLKYQSRRWMAGLAGTSTLNLDIVDYPGEWLLDLPLLSQSFAEWSAANLPVNPLLNGPTHDANGNGIPNLIEFIAPQPLSLQITGGTATLTLSRNTLARGVTLIVECSDDLTTWTAPSELTATLTDADTFSKALTIDRSKRFFRSVASLKR